MQLLEDMYGKIKNKRRIVTGITCVVLIWIHVVAYKDRKNRCKERQQTYHPLPIYLRAIDDRSNQDILVLRTTLMEQRNALSKQLNNFSRQFAQLECKVRILILPSDT